MTIKELKQNILLSLYHRYKDNKSTTIDLKELCAQDNLIFDSLKQVVDAAKGLKDAGYINLVLYNGDNGTIMGITSAGIEYVEENLLTKEELVSDGLSDTSKMVQSGIDVHIDVPGDESDAGNTQSQEELRKSVKCYNKQSLYSVYQYNNIFHILAKKQRRNKINNLSDSPLFTFHLVSSLALGRIQSTS